MRRFYRELIAGSALVLVMSASAAHAQVNITYPASGNYHSGTGGTITTNQALGTFLIVSPGVVATELDNIVDGPPVIPPFPFPPFPGPPIAISGGGTLTLSGNNTYTTGTSIVGPTTVIAGSDTAFGTGTITLASGGFPASVDPATLGYADGVTIDNSVFFGSFSESQIVNFSVESGSATQAGDIFAFFGTLVKTGAGELMLTDTTPTIFNAAIVVDEGTLGFTNAAVIGARDITLEGGTLLSAPAAGGSIDLVNNIVVGDFLGNGVDTAINAGISAATGTTLSLQGDFIIAADNAVITFGSAEDQGTVVFDSSAIATDPFLPILDPGRLMTTSYVVAGGTLESGSGPLTDLLMFGASTTIKSGGTLITGTEPSIIRNLKGESGGEVVIGDDDFFGTPGLTLWVDPGTSTEFAGVISGTGSVLAQTTPFISGTEPGRVILSGNNTYSGNTYICDCTELQIGNGGTTGTLGAGSVFNAGTLIFNRSDTYVVNNTISDDPLVIASPGKVVQDGIGTVVLAATNSYSGGTFLNSGTLSVSSEANLGDLSGGLSFDGGILQVTGTALKSTARTIAWDAGGGGFDIVEATNVFTVSQQIDGTGGMIKDGAGTLLLTGDNSYSGGTVIKEGTLSLGTNTAAGTGAITTQGSVIDYVNGVVIANPIVIDSNTTQLQVVTGTATQTGSISELNGPRPMEKIGAGNLILSGVNTYTGGTTVSAGTLTISGAGTLGAASGKTTVQGGSTLDLGGTSQTQNGGVTLVSGTITSGALSSSGVFDLQSGTVSAALGGAGSLTKTTAGSVTLSGVNSYTGGTTVSEGTLKAGVAGAFVNSTAYTVNGGKLDLSGFDLTMSSFSGTGGEVALGKAALTLDQASDSAFAGAITGTGSFTKSGAGIFTLTGASTYTGATTVDEGTLSVDGSIVSPVTVDSGGILAGNGSVGSTRIDNGGTIAPGHSIGTLTVGGSIGFSAGSTYAVEVDASTADLIQVRAAGSEAGTADLSGGTVAASYAPASYIEKSYTILTTTGGLGGTGFAGLTGTAPTGFTQSLQYDADNVYLVLDMEMRPPEEPGTTGSPTYDALTVNQRSVANALVGYFDANGGIPAIYAALDPDGLTLASGELATAAIQSNFIAADRFLDEISSRFVLSDSGGGKPTPVQEPAAYAPGTALPGAASGAYAALMDERSHAMTRLGGGDWQAWGSAYGVSASADGDKAYIGSHDLDASLWGLAAGAGWRDGDSAFGLALGGGGSNFDLDGGLGSGDAGIFNAGVYGLAEFGQGYLSGALAYGYYDVSTSRSLFGETLEANYGAHSFSGRAEAGWRFDTMGVGFTPYAAFQATALSIPDYAETYAGTSAFALSYDGQTANTARGELGLRLDKTVMLESAALKLSGRVAWAHASEPDNSFTTGFQALPGTSFTVIGADAPVDSALLDLGATLAFDNGVAAGLAFNGQFADGYASYSGSARLSIKW